MNAWTRGCVVGLVAFALSAGGCGEERCPLNTVIGTLQVQVLGPDDQPVDAYRVTLVFDDGEQSFACPDAGDAGATVEPDAGDAAVSLRFLDQRCLAHGAFSIDDLGDGRVFRVESADGSLIAEHTVVASDLPDVHDAGTPKCPERSRSGSIKIHLAAP